MKKFWAILLAVMLVLSMTVVAGAEATGDTEPTTSAYTITVKPTDGADHTYEVYQIFTGNVTTSTDEETKVTSTILANVKWGKNAKNGADAATEGELVPEAVLEELTKTTGSNNEKLAVIKKYVDLTSTPVATFVSTKATPGTSTALAPGYYLVKDKDASLDEKDGAYSTMMVQVLEDNITITAKSEKPSVDKQVWDETADAEEGNKDGWGESADHTLFEKFDFRLVATLPASSAYDDYNEYKVTFYDTMSAGVTFVGIKSVKVNGITIEAGAGKDQYTTTATANQAGGNWSLTIPDLKSVGQVVEGGEKAPININAGVEIEVIYTAFLNENAQTFNASATKTDNENTVSLGYSNNPNVEGGGEGKTPEDHVWLFTYRVNNTKYQNKAEEGNELAGAGFTLFVDNTEKPVIPLMQKLNDNVVIDGEYYVYDGEHVPTGFQAVANNEMITKADGKFNVIGLDHGSYILEETTVPAGYNALDPYKFSISAKHAEATDGASASVELEANSGMNNSIVNKSGAQLPETGGIGTTIFYVLGGMMFVGAALILIVRRKAEADEN